MVPSTAVLSSGLEDELTLDTVVEFNVACTTGIAAPELRTAERVYINCFFKDFFFFVGVEGSPNCGSPARTQHFRYH